MCKVCNGDLTFQEDPVKKLGHFTGPHLVCRTCHKQTFNNKCALKARDTMRIKHSKYKAGEKGKSLRKKARRKKKILIDCLKKQEGIVYAPGTFGEGMPDPNSVED